MLKQTQNLKLMQKLLPAMILNQKILTIPTLALENIIKKELEQNPMLEEEGDTGTSDSDITDPVTEDSSITDSGDDSKTENDETDIADKEETDWDEYFENENETPGTGDYTENKSFDNGNISEESSLNSGLLLQIHLSELSAKKAFIGEEIIWSLSDDGYFTENNADILADLEVKKSGTEFENESFTEEEIDETLKFIQTNLDPPGIAARNLKECLLIQTDRSEKPPYIKKLAGNIIENHLDDLRLKRFENVSRDLNIETSFVSEIFEFIHKLNPKPGFIEKHESENYIVPDLIVKKVDDNYEIFLNERFIPSLRLSRTYQKMYSNKRNKLDKQTKEYILNNFNKAKWFIEAINSRRETMLKVMNAIINRQRDYFDNNGEGLKPMYEKEIAADINMDPSTVSRTVKGKYVQTDFGIFELRSFFSSSLQTDDGGEISNRELKIKLKDLIDNEDKRKPLTDSELAVTLIKSGYKIARRTVAKYRESLNVPPSKLRREII